MIPKSSHSNLDDHTIGQGGGDVKGQIFLRCDHLCDDVLTALHIPYGCYSFWSGFHEVLLNELYYQGFHTMR